MKFLQLFLGLAISLSISGQSIEVYDLFTISESFDMVHIKRYVEGMTSYEYAGNLNEGDWDVYRFTNGENRIHVGLVSVMKDGEVSNMTFVQYYVFDNSEYQIFLKSLVKEKFEVFDSKIDDDGNPSKLYHGTKTMLEQLKIISIISYPDHYKVTAL